MSKLLCLGMGYVAQSLAARFEGEVSGTSRSAEKRQALSSKGYAMSVEPQWQGVTHLLISASPDAKGCPVFRADLPASLQWVGYCSTTGVYGDTGGAWVDETSPTQPTEPRSQWRLTAESQWQSVGGHIFRLAGIYGEGRNALEDIRAGTARRIDKKGQFFSRIHVEDIASVLLASMVKPDPKTIYNVCDDLPSPSHEVVAFAAELLGVEPPPLQPFDEAILSPMAQSFYRANRRVKNDKIKRAFGIELAYPDYRVGLTAINEKETLAT